MKIEKELEALRNEAGIQNKKFAKLTEAELDHVSGGLSNELQYAAQQKVSVYYYFGAIDANQVVDILTKAMNAQTVEEYNAYVSAFAASKNLPPEAFTL